jgi:WD40 repeat protein
MFFFERAQRAFDSGQVNHQCRVRSVTFSPDGKTVATGGDGARLWDPAAGRPLGQPFQHQCRVRCVAVSPDGKTILTAGVIGRRGCGMPLPVAPSEGPWYIRA